MKRFLFAVLLFSSRLAFGQWFDSAAVGYSTLLNRATIFPDTQLTAQNYLGLTDFVTDTFGMITMGSQGDVRRNLLFDFSPDINPHLGIQGYFKNMRTISNIPIWNVKVPMGGVRTLTGYNRGQMFGLFFTLNPGSRSNVFLDYQRINSRGEYFNQENKADQLSFSFSYLSQNGKYSLLWLLGMNQNSNREFGGVADQLAFEEENLKPRELIDVALQNSYSKAVMINTAFLQDYKLANLGKNASFKGFYHIGLQKQSYSFVSTDSVFVRNALFDSSTIRDSISFLSVNQFAGLSVDFNKGAHLIQAGLVGSYFQMGNEYFALAENLIGIKGEARGRLKSLDYFASFQSWMSGSYLGSYNFSGKIRYNTGQWTVTAYLNQGLYLPGQFYQRYVSNNFVWSKELAKMAVADVGGSIARGGNSLSVGYNIIGNYVYFNEQALPVQASQASNVVYADLSVPLRIFGNFRMNNRLRYQVTDRSEYIRIPNWVIRSLLYHQKKYFNGNLDAQLGIEFQYFSSFSSDAFMPATSVMILQNGQEIGNFPYFNFFAGIKIKEVNVYVKLENVAEGLFPRNYYAAPNYPLPDFAIRLGATWRFFN